MCLSIVRSAWRARAAANPDGRARPVQVVAGPARRRSQLGVDWMAPANCRTIAAQKAGRSAGDRLVVN
jgi:hypothetical protein